MTQVTFNIKSFSKISFYCAQKGIDVQVAALHALRRSVDLSVGGANYTWKLEGLGAYIFLRDNTELGRINIPLALTNERFAKMHYGSRELDLIYKGFIDKYITADIAEANNIIGTIYFPRSITIFKPAEGRVDFVDDSLSPEDLTGLSLLSYSGLRARYFS